MSYAIIQIQGKQFHVSPGQKITVDRIPNEVESSIEISDVLFVSLNDGVFIGQPLVKKAIISAKVISHHKGDKIRVATYRNKSRYRRVKGHRSHLTELQITDISFGK